MSDPNDELIKIPGVDPDIQLLASDPVEKLAYDRQNSVYASSTYEIDHDMNPGLIVFPKDISDIVSTLQYAKENNRSVAVRTGGHQYSGASSTGQQNILLDLRTTFQGDITRIDPIPGSNPEPKAPNIRVRTSVSWSLEKFSAWLVSQGLFIPHGECYGVFLGGHVQTGGYGQLGRSFGLLGDHVVSLELVDPDNGPTYKKTISKEEDSELFYAILGGSPGNFGIVTHFTLQVYSETDYVGAQGLWALHYYHEDKLRALLSEVAALNDDVDKPRNYDLSVSILSDSIHFFATIRDVWDKFEQMTLNHEGIKAFEQISLRSIVVFAQWVPFSDTDQFSAADLAWFDRLKDPLGDGSGPLHTMDTTDDSQWAPNKKGLGILNKTLPEKPKMATIASWWTFPIEREFDFPYIKRTYATDSAALTKDGFVDWVVPRLHEVINPISNGLFLAAQFQPYGGKNSQHFNNGPKGKTPNGTSYSWRDTTMIATMDCFHRPEAVEQASIWASTNDDAMAPGGVAGFGPTQDRRLLWGSYEKKENIADFDMQSAWPFYYDDIEKYNHLRKLRTKYDPAGLYSPNVFSVPNTVAPSPGDTGAA